MSDTARMRKFFSYFRLYLALSVAPIAATTALTSVTAPAEQAAVAPSHAETLQADNDWRSRWQKRVIEMTESGVLPRPVPSAVESFDMSSAAKELGLQAVPSRYRTRQTYWRLPSGKGRVENITLSLRVCDSWLAARIALLSGLTLSTVSVDVAVGVGASAEPKLSLTAHSVFSTAHPVPSRPIAGEMSTMALRPGGLAFVRWNCAVRITARPVIDGVRADPDAVTGTKVRELAEALDGLLMNAPHKTVRDEWLPRIEAVSVELPSPVVGRPFRMDARVSLHGKPCPAGRIRLDWRLHRQEDARHQVLYPARQKTEPAPTSVLYTVDRPGWWAVRCDVSYDGSPVESRELLLFVAPASSGERGD